LSPEQGGWRVPTLTPTEIYNVCLTAGFTPDQAVTWTAIALAESGGNTGAHNPSGEDSWGLWQINVDPAVRGNPWGDLTDPVNNARAAYEVSRGGTDMRPWTVTHAGNAGTAHDYRQFMDEARAAAGGQYAGDFSGVSGYHDPNRLGGDEPGGPPPPAPATAEPDADRDGAGDAFEMSKGTNPEVADSDLDGLTDGYELDHGSNPLALDSDLDGLSDAYERQVGSDATQADTDADGLSDSVEVAQGRDPDAGVPLGPDGQPVAVDATDTDLDGLSDGFEAALGTDATLADTDGDGLGDAQEQSTGLDPTAVDTDADGVVDDADMDPDAALVVGPGGPLGTLITPPGIATLAGVGTAAPPAAPPVAGGEPDPVVAPPPEGADALTRTFLDHALAQTGDSYVFGAEAPTGDADPGVFDCSELVQWSAGQIGIEMPDGSWLQYLELKEAGAVIPVEQAATTPGALLFSFDREPTAGGGRPGSAHVAISLGDGTTIEARGTRYGVGSWDTGDRFQYAAVIPGLGTTLVPGDAPDPAALVPAASLTAGPDTDRDGAADPYEMERGTDPLLPDSDDDGLTDGLELARQTDALAVDTDTDGLSDAFEVQAGIDAGNADSDADGLTDAYELAALGDATSAPTGVVMPTMAGQAATALLDSDEDGLSDAWESSLGTDPLHGDSDGDGFGDALEAARGTDPLLPDDDADDLVDP
jgi:hypothetical protein